MTYVHPTCPQCSHKKGGTDHCRGKLGLTTFRCPCPDDHRLTSNQRKAIRRFHRSSEGTKII